MNLLRIENLSKSFGGVQAVQDFDMVQQSEEISAIIGPNGAGKTTIFNLITAVTECDAGRIFFRDREITGLPAHKRTRLGIARTFQNIRLFNDLNVQDNLKVACDPCLGYSIWAEMLGLGRVRRDEKAIADLSRRYLADFGLEKYGEYKPNKLPYGLQRRLELARALIAEPSLLLLDEPAAGLNPRETNELMHFIAGIQAKLKIAIILVEHHMDLVMNICHNVHVLDFGRKIAEGKPAEIKQNPEVLKAYLGDQV